MSPKYYAALLFGVGSVITSGGVCWWASFPVALYFLMIPYVVFAVFWSVKSLDRYNFGDLKQVVSVEWRGIRMGLRVVFLTMLCGGLFWGVLFSVIESSLEFMLSGLALALFAIILTFGVPFIVGGVLGWLVSQYSFEYINHNKQPESSNVA